MPKQKTELINHPENITQFIFDYAQGNKSALGDIVDALYVQLCDMAQLQLRKLNPEMITPSDLVHEVYLKFSKSLSLDAKGRMHFLAIAATAMRQLIVDQVRNKSSKKRGGQLCATTLSDSKLPVSDNYIEILAIDQAMEKLKEIEPKLASTVECRYFAGYSEQETAEALDVTIRTVRRYWQRAKNWLKIELED